MHLAGPLCIHFTLEIIWPQHHHPAAFVIAQQYSFIASVSLSYRSGKERYYAFQKCYFLIFPLFLKKIL